jgi:hypothetical protein
MHKVTLNYRMTTVADIKKYNLKGVNSSVELGKKGSYISGNADAVSFFTVNNDLQKVSIANATLATHAITKGQLDAVTEELVQHITVEFDFESGASVDLASIASGTRVFGVTVDVPTTWTASDNTATYVEIGDSGNSARFIRAQDVDVLIAGQYHSQYQYEYDSADTLKLSVTGGDASAGVGSVSILLSTGIIAITDYGSIVSSADANSDLGNIA